MIGDLTHRLTHSDAETRKISQFMEQSENGIATLKGDPVKKIGSPFRILSIKTIKIQKSRIGIEDSKSP